MPLAGLKPLKLVETLEKNQKALLLFYLHRFSSRRQDNTRRASCSSKAFLFVHKTPPFCQDMKGPVLSRIHTLLFYSRKLVSLPFTNTKLWTAQGLPKMLVVPFLSRPSFIRWQPETIICIISILYLSLQFPNSCYPTFFLLPIVCLVHWSRSPWYKALRQVFTANKV